MKDSNNRETKDQEKMRKSLEKLELDKKKTSSHGSQQNIDDREEPAYSGIFSHRPCSMRERRSSSRTQQEGGAASAGPRRSSIRKTSEQAKTADQGQETQPLPDRQSWRHKSLPSRGLPSPIKKKSSLPKSETATGSDKTSQDTTIPPTTSPDKGRDKHTINQEQGSGTGQESRKSSLASNPITKESLEHEFQASKHGHRGSLCKESSHCPRKSSLAPDPSEVFKNINQSPEAPRWYDHALKAVMEAYKDTPQTHGASPQTHGASPQTHGASPPGETQAPAQEEYLISFRAKDSVIKVPKRMPDISRLDKPALDDLRDLLTEARIDQERMPVIEYGNHSQNRLLRRRVEGMRTIFIKLGKHSCVIFNPSGMKDTTCVRLSQQNEETLAKFAIESGEKTGIHAHSEVPNCDILEPSV